LYFTLALASTILFGDRAPTAAIAAVPDESLTFIRGNARAGAAVAWKKTMMGDAPRPILILERNDTMRAPHFTPVAIDVALRA